MSSAGARSSATSTSAMMGRNWLYRIRYDKEANDEIPGSVFDLEDVENGILRLPQVKIRRMAFYYSRFWMAADTDDAAAHEEDQQSVEEYQKGDGGGAVASMPAEAPGILSSVMVPQDDEDDGLYATTPDWDLFSHVYVVMETEDGTYHSMEKFEDYVDFRSSSDPISVVQYQWGDTGRMGRTNVEFAKTTGWRTPHDANGPLYLNEVIPFLHEEVQAPYHFTNNNCRHFAQRFFQFFVQDPSRNTMFHQQQTHVCTSGKS
eukprot:CAMPEP_0198142840 /NCGR_PEP_ID=MMETSP1443-20131203/5518_1 /TAXON_ID=186043 /ORGANISM="Entomoneis sp., Strain CCMP2396" /LENGTH=260 /DNA_ID=CAMNT_0043805943 /DNA_START=122 /DNA_END=904 /DNA_ORIENTATION=+